MNKIAIFFAFSLSAFAADWKDFSPKVSWQARLANTTAWPADLASGPTFTNVGVRIPDGLPLYDSTNRYYLGAPIVTHLSTGVTLMVECLVQTNNPQAPADGGAVLQAAQATNNVFSRMQINVFAPRVIDCFVRDSAGAFVRAQGSSVATNERAIIAMTWDPAAKVVVGYKNGVEFSRATNTAINTASFTPTHASVGVVFSSGKTSGMLGYVNRFAVWSYVMPSNLITSLSELEDEQP